MSTDLVARDFAQRIDERDWDGLAALLVADDHRAVLRVHCFDDDISPYVACFLTLTDGLVTELVEAWTDDTTTEEIA